MIQILGLKRILVLIILIGINAGLAAASYLYVQPEKQQQERNLRSTRSQIASKRAEADRLRDEFSQIEAQKADFEMLKASGFMSDQNRLVARRRIMDVQQYSKVLKAIYDIKPAVIEDNPIAGAIDHVVLNSPISVNVEAMDDADFYSFIYWMENGFPGHIALRRLRLERTRDMTDMTYRAIGSQQAVTMITGSAEFSWRTIVPKEDVVPDDSFGSEGF